MGVFKMDKKFEVVLNPDAVKLVPELSTLTQKELRYVILVIDYVDSPYRKKPYHERQMMARKSVFKDSRKNPETEKLQNAMEAYKSLVFDIRRETLDMFKKKVITMQKQMNSPDCLGNEITQLDKSITILENRIQSIEHDLNLEETENITLKAGRKLSYIEIWQRNQKAYDEYKSSI
jgi:hypothetical protein